MINYYIILEIPNFSEEPIIKKAYRTLSKKYHPDVNKDSSAVDYFLKVKEAYEFLMNENKRLLLNQFLIAGHQSQRVYQQSETFYQAPPKPVIHYFSTDRKNFALGDYVLIQWNISQCKSVFINMIGNVEFSGTHYLKIENFIDELVILMTIKGLDDVEYKYQIK
ncbi:MAG TPA: DnaJ domain-containing protein, partial [Flavobacterium sp.]|nr:DnaJ domain-containing protein [Flavobacterium sp.]